MNAAAWISAALSDETPVCMGLKLRPYSIGHALLLARHDSSFALGGPITLGDMVLAVLVCSQTFRDAQGTLNAWWAKWYVKYWGWHMRKLNIISEAKTFQAYRETGTWLPNINFKLENARMMTAPQAVWLLAFLVKDCGMAPAEALDVPIARANALLYADMDSRGEVNFQSDSEREAVRMAKQLGLETEQTEEKGAANGSF